jgi:putative membrane protein
VRALRPCLDVVAGVRVGVALKESSTKEVPAMMYDDAGWGWWMMGAGFLGVLLILVAGAVAVLLAVRSGHGQAGGTAGAVRGLQPSAAALEALEVRFARGEVDEETYRRSRDLLTRPPGW